MKSLTAFALSATFALAVVGCTDSTPESVDIEPIGAAAAADDAVAAGAGSNCNVPNEEDGKTFGLILNLNSLLCAKVVRVCPLQVRDALEVTCVEYRGGTATKTYIVDTKTATAFEQ